MNREQYDAVKQTVGEQTIVLFNVGDCYEAWYEDAPVVAAALDIPTTTTFVVFRSHMLDGLLRFLIGLQHRVAVCEQHSPV